MEQLQPKKWYDKTSIVILLCIFLFPVGLYALWKSNVIEKKWKIIDTIIISTLVIIAASQEPPKTQLTDSKSNSVVELTKTAVDSESNSAQVMLASTATNDTAIEQTISTPEQKRPTDEEFVKYFQTKYDSIKLIRRWNQAPLYGEYANALAAVFNEIDSYDSIYNIGNIPQIKSIYNLAEKKNSEALKNYLKYVMFPKI